MRLTALVFLLASVVTACSTSSGPSESGLTMSHQTAVFRKTNLDSVRVSYPVNAAALEDGECVTPPRLPVASDATRLHMIWGPPSAPERRVAVTFDQLGELHRYSDVRGGMLNIHTRGQAVPGTSIHIDFKEGRVLIQDQDENGDTRNRIVGMEEGSEAAVLGNPASTIDFVVNRCGWDRGSGSR